MKLYFDWMVRANSGWGLLGYHLVKQAMLAGDELTPLAPLERSIGNFSVFDEPLLAYLTYLGKDILPLAKSDNYADPTGVTLTLISHMNLASETMGDFFKRYHAKQAKRLGIGFFEHDGFLAEALSRLIGQLEKLVVGSQWNYDLLRKKNVPADKLALIYQGYDQQTCFPYQAARAQDGRFYLYSGGKLELRKAQDVVLQAFAKFAKDIPQAVLVTHWHDYHNVSSAQNINGSGVTAVEFHFDEAKDKLNLMATAKAIGIPSQQIIELGLIHNQHVPNILRYMHGAVFPNRAEGGTNQVAVEAIACGLPVILASGHGQGDLIKLMPELAELALYKSTKINFHTPPEFPKVIEYQSMAKLWQWTVADELYQNMHKLYENYQHHERQAAKLAEKIKTLFSWQKYYQEIKELAQNL